LVEAFLGFVGALFGLVAFGGQGGIVEAGDELAFVDLFAFVDEVLFDGAARGGLDGDDVAGFDFAGEAEVAREFDRWRRRGDGGARR
jgi:hypothetical protein